MTGIFSSCQADANVEENLGGGRGEEKEKEEAGRVKGREKQAVHAQVDSRVPQVPPRASERLLPGEGVSDIPNMMPCLVSWEPK